VAILLDIYAVTAVVSGPINRRSFGSTSLAVRTAVNIAIPSFAADFIIVLR
jgi:hypothetical protein